jgi:hypothetical protein
MKFVPNAISSRIGHQALLLEKASPNLLFGAGIVGFVGTVVLASRATLKIDETLEATQKELARIEEASLLIDGRGDRVHSDHDIRHDKAIVYVRAVKDVTKLYGPAIIVGVVSVGCLTKSHSILTKRNAALTAAYAAVEKAFNEYRERVREELGEEKERELYYPLEACEIEDEDSDKKGKKEVATKRRASMYARFFDRENRNWNPEPFYNLAFLRSQQNFANDKLRAKGHILLNDVYDSLGMERTTAGAVVGWLWQAGGDNYVDFGIFNRKMEPEHFDFFNGHENAILLDFNVDGVVYDKIDKIQDSRRP